MCAILTAQAQITIVKNGKAKGRIVRVERNTNNDEAAHLLQRFVERISGAQLPLVDGIKPRSGDIVIGEKTDKAKEDGFALE
ncbi:MAG: DUF4838 domain-containing protein, partial [Prevotella sp.]|nr:DUF4838 domain-containing protein [Prevotella sp.]